MPDEDDRDNLEHWLDKHVTPAGWWSNIGPVQVVVFLAVLLLVIHELIDIAQLIWSLL
jgi:hypothetical protein